MGEAYLVTFPGESKMYKSISKNHWLDTGCYLMLEKRDVIEKVEGTRYISTNKEISMIRFDEEAAPEEDKKDETEEEKGE